MSGDRVVNSSGVVNRDDDMLDRTLKKTMTGLLTAAELLRGKAMCGTEHAFY